MNEHTFFEWKRSERLTAALALAFCLLGLGLQRLPGGGLFRKAELGTGGGLSGAAGPEPVEPPPPGMEDFAADRPNRTGGAGSGLVGGGGLGHPGRTPGRVRPTGGRGDRSGGRGQRHHALRGPANPHRRGGRYLKAHPDIPAVLSGGQGPGRISPRPGLCMTR